MHESEGTVKRAIWIRNYPAQQSVVANVEFAVAAEDAGWDGVFVSDSITDGSTDPWATLGAIASRTERITLGTWITAPATQPPWRLARTVATLDQLSQGRMLLGVGLGVGPDFHRFGDTATPRERARRYDEALEIITRLWSGDAVTFHGEFFQLDGVRLPVLPIQRPRVPILVAGWWPNRSPFDRAAGWDGTMPFWPALLEGDTGPEGQLSTGTIEGELRELAAYYHEVAETPGDIVLPCGKGHDPAYTELAEEVGATWLLTAEPMELEEVHAGPPR